MLNEPMVQLEALAWNHLNFSMVVEEEEEVVEHHSESVMVN